MPRIDELLMVLKEGSGSDLHLAAGLEPRLRIDGSMTSVEGWDPLDNEEVRALIRPIVSDAQWLGYDDCGDLDFAYGLEGVARFRANFFVQERGAGAVFRIIPEKIIALEDLNLPEAIGKLVELEKGLVLVTGPTGSSRGRPARVSRPRSRRSSTASTAPRPGTS